jgi:hypothetical protein
VRVSPSRVVPEIDAAAVGTGADGLTDAGAEASLALPAAFVAVTTTRMRRPVSAAVVVYVRAVAPAMSAQSAPLVSQRCHW